MALLIDGERVEEAAIRHEMRRLRERHREVTSEHDSLSREQDLRRCAAWSLTDRILIRREAARDPAPLDPALLEAALRDAASATNGDLRGLPPEDLRREVDARMRVDRLTRKILGAVTPPKPKEATEYYRKHREQFLAAEQLHAAHIIRNVDEQHPEETALAAIEAVRDELESGADFGELADRHSDCPGNRGDLGWFQRGQMVSEFEAVAFALAAGETSGIIRTMFGFHIVRVIEKRPAGYLSLAEVRTKLEAILLREKQERAVEAFMERLRTRAVIEEVYGSPE